MRQILSGFLLVSLLTGCGNRSTRTTSAIAPRHHEDTDTTAATIIAAYLSQRPIFLDGVPLVSFCRMGPMRDAVLSEQVFSLIKAGVIVGVDTTCPGGGSQPRRTGGQTMIEFGSVRVIDDTVEIVAWSQAATRCASLEEQGKMWRQTLGLRMVSLHVRHWDCGPPVPPRTDDVEPPTRIEP